MEQTKTHAPLSAAERARFMREFDQLLKRHDDPQVKARFKGPRKRPDEIPAMINNPWPSCYPKVRS